MPPKNTRAAAKASPKKSASSTAVASTPPTVKKTARQAECTCSRRRPLRGDPSTCSMCSRPYPLKKKVKPGGTRRNRQETDNDSSSSSSSDDDDSSSHSSSSSSSSESSSSSDDASDSDSESDSSSTKNKKKPSKKRNKKRKSSKYTKKKRDNKKKSKSSKKKKNEKNKKKSPKKKTDENESGQVGRPLTDANKDLKRNIGVLGDTGTQDSIDQAHNAARGVPQMNNNNPDVAAGTTIISTDPPFRSLESAATMRAFRPTRQAFIDTTYGQYVALGHKPSQESESMSAHSLKGHINSSTTKYKGVNTDLIPSFATASVAFKNKDDYKQLEKVNVRCCNVCFGCFVSSAKFANSSSSQKAHAASCQAKLDGNTDVGAKSLDQDKIDQAVVDMFIHSGTSGNQLQRVCQILYSAFPEHMAFMKKYTHSMSSFMSARKDGSDGKKPSLLAKAAADLNNFLTSLLANKTGLTICVDAGTSNGTHLVVVSVCVDRKLYVLRPQTAPEGVDSAVLVNCITAALSTVGKKFEDIGFIVADAASTNKCAFDKIEQMLMNNHKNDEKKTPLTKNEQEDYNIEATTVGTMLGEVGFEEDEAGDQTLADNDSALGAADGVKFNELTKHFDDLYSNETMIPVTRTDVTFHPHKIYVVSCLGHYAHNLMKWVFSDKAIRPLFSTAFDFRLRFARTFSNNPKNATRRAAWQDFIQSNITGQLLDPGEKSTILDSIENAVNKNSSMFEDPLKRRRVVMKLYENRTFVFGPGFTSQDLPTFGKHFYGQMLPDGAPAFAKEAADEARFTAHQAKEFVDAIKKKVKEVRAREEKEETDRKHFSTKVSFSGQTRWAESHFHSMEHIFNNITLIYKFLVKSYEKSHNFCDSLRALASLAATKTRTFMTESLCYFMVTRPVMLFLQSFSDHSVASGAAAYDSLTGIVDAYKTMSEIFGSMVNTFDATKDREDVLFDVPSMTSLDAQVDALFTEAKHTEEKYEMMEERAAIADCSQKMANFKLQFDRLMDISLAGKKVFSTEDRGALLHLFQSRRAIHILSETCGCFHINLNEGAWRSYQSKLEYQNRSLWKLCKSLSPAEFVDFMGQNGGRKAVEVQESIRNLQKECGSICNLTELKNEFDRVQKVDFVKLSTEKNCPEVFDGTTWDALPITEFWNSAVFEDFPQLRQLADSLFNVAPVVTSVDSFFSVAGSVTDKRRLITRNNNSTPLVQTWLKANGSYDRRLHCVPWFFCDRSTAAERRDIYTNEKQREADRLHEAAVQAAKAAKEAEESAKALSGDAAVAPVPPAPARATEKSNDSSDDEGTVTQD